MGNLSQKMLRKMGVSEQTIKYFFETTRDKMLSAIQSGDLYSVQLIRKQCRYDFADAISYDENNDNCLHVSVRFKRKEIAKYIVEQSGRSIVEDKNSNGDSALMIATMERNVELVKFLIEEGGASVNSRENCGATVFIAGCASGSEEMVAYLIGVDETNLYARNNDGQTALHRACFHGEMGVVKKLIWETKVLHKRHLV